MWNRFLHVIILILSILGYSSLTADEQEIEWAPNKNAKAYKLEVRDFSSKKVKVDKKIKETRYKIDKLDPGLYEYRIGIVNDKDIVAVYSDWSTLSIMQSFEPEGSVEEIYYGGKDDKFQEIYITGNNFFEDTKIEIFSEQGKIPIKNLIRVSDRELRFVLELSNAKPGTYDLKIINPLKKVYVKKGFYLLGKTKLEAEKVVIEAAKKSQGQETNVDRKYFVRSAFLPGWGQYSSGKDYDLKFRRVKGAILFSATIGLGVFAAYSYKEYILQKRATDDANYLNNQFNYPYNSNITPLGFYFSNQFYANVEDLDNKWHQFTRTSLILIGVYIFNLIDSYFFTGAPSNPTSLNGLLPNHQIRAYVSPDRNGFNQTGNSYSLEYSIRF
ncbi:MAG TPA: hypothetical protein PK079_15330 [Leptospiraceae bacterium]|nr:hypothetical protein [Leptospiraceae bacterium]HMX33090.1 hypothetical protein [Leptospiraceae bacterium]HMY32643.1 hypothetical protein [Leptospiraceae bacterium]HMZ63730.1 hypothetical protein [Leptospiraceae bacterium]HNA08015.1 hypothetical protein [Leptospiraceae bacterium]